jgi:hypothetical protein
MKNFNTFHAPILAAAFTSITLINGMDSIQDPMVSQHLDTLKKLPTATLISASDVIPSKLLPSTPYYLTSNNPPALILGMVKQPIKATQSETISIMNNLAKNNPDLARILNDPDRGSEFKKTFLKRFASPEVQTTVPVQYLIDKKPGDFIYFSGNAEATNPYGTKISEKEGTKITRTVLHSQNPKDPSFIQEPYIVHVATEKFAKDANKVIRRLEHDLASEKRRIGGAQTGDKYGMVSGWTGGKSLMDTEKREPSSRSK